WILLILITAGKAHAQQKAAAPTADTIQFKGLIIIKGKDARGKSSYKFYHDTAYARAKLKKNLHTKWFVVDVGFNNYIDRSDYTGASVIARYATNSYADITEKAYNYSA